MRTLWQDVRYGLRVMRKSPGFTAVAVVALALGIGANTAIFSVINGVLLKPLPFAEAERLVAVWHTNPQKGETQSPASYPNFVDWREQGRSFEAMAGFMPRGVSLTSVAEPGQLPGSYVTTNLFALLGAKPAFGRDFLPEEGRPGAPRVVIFSHGFWRQRFGADPSVVGKTVVLNGESHEVVGVMPEGFEFPVQGQFPIPPSSVWIPLASEVRPEERGDYMLFVVARLARGATLEGARAEMATVTARLEEQYPESNKGARADVVPLHEQIVQRVEPALFVLLAAVGLVLLIACANVANLLLARASARRKELAIRVALGARRARIIRQLLTESVLLAAMGGTLGLVLTLWGMDVLLGALPSYMPRASEIGVDRRVLLFTVALSTLTGLVFGLAPAWRATKNDLNEALKEGGKTSSAGGSRSMRNALVVAEVALALVLLTGAGLLIRSFRQLQQVSLGFNPENVLAVPFAMPQTRYPSGAERAAFIAQVVERVKGLPGVEAVGGTTILPLGSDMSSGEFAVEGRTLAPGEKNRADLRIVTADYFRLMGIRLAGGRTFDERDKYEAEPVVIINETMARTYWPGEDPIGKRIKTPPGPESPWTTVVGVVGDVRFGGLAEEPRPEMYFHYSQDRIPFLNLVVKTKGDAAAAAASVRNEIWAVDKDLPLAPVTTLEQLLSSSLSARRFNMTLLGIFSALALTLAAVGIYGVMAYTVAQRTHEIGIRMALGARPRDVLRLVIGHGMALTLAGVGLGLVAALAATRVMSSMLFGVSATDPFTFASVALLLALVALAACYLPAHRATKVDPMVALRYE